MEGRFILFTRPHCSFCTKAIELLDIGKKRYNVVNFEKEQQEALDDIKTAYEWGTVPMVFYRVENTISFIGGYTDLIEYFEQEKTK